MNNHRVAFILMASVIGLGNGPPGTVAFAKNVQKRQLASRSIQTGQSDVVVTKNADGTIDVHDNGEYGVVDTAKTSTSAPAGSITYKPAPEAVLHYADGVIVHRHADGSVEVSDDDSDRPVFHSFNSTQANHHALSSRTKSTIKHGAPKDR